MFVNLGKLPSAPKQYQKLLSGFYGGLCTKYRPTDIAENQCSELKNMLWDNGVLRNRPAAVNVPIETGTYPTQFHNGFGAYEYAWHGCIVFVQGKRFYAYSPTTKEVAGVGGEYPALENGEGSFFRFGEELFYKCIGGYYRIMYSGSDGEGEPGNLDVEAVSGYIPIIQINTSRDGVGDLYQFENRIQASKQIWFNADPGVEVVEIPCDGVTTSFNVKRYTSANPLLQTDISVSTEITGATVSVNKALLLQSDIAGYIESICKITYKIVNDEPKWVLSLQRYEGEQWFDVKEIAPSDLATVYGITISGVETFTEGDEVFISVVRDSSTELLSIDSVYCGAALLVAGTDYSVDLEDGTITLLDGEGSYVATHGIPSELLNLTVRCTVSATMYRLPFGALDGIAEVLVNNTNYSRVESRTELESGTYYADLLAGTIEFSQNFGVYNDAAFNANFIKVTVEKDNPVARGAIEQCSIATTFGSTGIEDNCVVLSGYRAIPDYVEEITMPQPNAIFWSGNGTYGADPTYFPIEYYNLVGEYDDPVTAFGRQQDRLVIFQERRVSSAVYTNTGVDGRTVVNLPVKTINDRIGCDVPGSVQLIENNLIWANKKFGIMYLRDSTYAYETLVTCISPNINEQGVNFRGLIADLQHGDNLHACSMDDGKRYWLTLKSDTWTEMPTYVWDYSLGGSASNTDKLCWFYCTGLPALKWSLYNDKPYALAADSMFTLERNEYSDFGTLPIENVARIQTQIFGTFDMKKNVDTAYIVCTRDTPINTKITYITDNGERDDLSNLVSSLWSIAPRDLRRRELFGGRSIDAVFARKPKCLHIHHFTMRLSNNELGYGLTLQTVQLLYNYQGVHKGWV